MVPRSESPTREQKSPVPSIASFFRFQWTQEKNRKRVNHVSSGRSGLASQSLKRTNPSPRRDASLTNDVLGIVENCIPETNETAFSLIHHDCVFTTQRPRHVNATSLSPAPPPNKSTRRKSKVVVVDCAESVGRNCNNQISVLPTSKTIVEATPCKDQKKSSSSRFSESQLSPSPSCSYDQKRKKQTKRKSSRNSRSRTRPSSTEMVNDAVDSTEIAGRNKERMESPLDVKSKRRGKTNKKIEKSHSLQGRSKVDLDFGVRNIGDKRSSNSSSKKKRAKCYNSDPTIKVLSPKSRRKSNKDKALLLSQPAEVQLPPKMQKNEYATSNNSMLRNLTVLSGGLRSHQLELGTPTSSTSTKATLSKELPVNGFRQIPEETKMKEWLERTAVSWKDLPEASNATTQSFTILKPISFEEKSKDTSAYEVASTDDSDISGMLVTITKDRWCDGRSSRLNKVPSSQSTFWMNELATTFQTLSSVEESKFESSLGGLSIPSNDNSETDPLVPDLYSGDSRHETLLENPTHVHHTSVNSKQNTSKCEGRSNLECPSVMTEGHDDESLVSWFSLYPEFDDCASSLTFLLDDNGNIKCGRRKQQLKQQEEVFGLSHRGKKDGIFIISEVKIPLETSLTDVQESKETKTSCDGAESTASLPKPIDSIGSLHENDLLQTYVAKGRAKECTATSKVHGYSADNVWDSTHVLAMSSHFSTRSFPMDDEDDDDTGNDDEIFKDELCVMPLGHL
ncbi:hypothetical protein IV203_000720 [Nitzschia inconspicua]|uniref:Uncharacterized protein n=1 Tax=Nitzschia inconspicua TaxID=303405 RepID=A0A9K3L6K3_9STRA|nr:hypothetical protein IV203_000720 [Nitzschia inconspicua]